MLLQNYSVAHVLTPYTSNTISLSHFNNLVEVAADASGTIGWGAATHDREWGSNWTPDWDLIPIHIKELYAAYNALLPIAPSL